jgi:hypothetical protein
MRFAFLGLLCSSMLALCGCGAPGSSSSTPGLAAKHGGNIISLPNGKGLAELLIDRGPAQKAVVGKAGKGGTARLIAYFYQPDGSAPLSPPPSDVKVHLGSADKGQDVKLTPQTSPEGQFASEPGQYPDELRGQLELSLGGQPVEVPFMFR